MNTAFSAGMRLIGVFGLDGRDATNIEIFADRN